MNLESEAMKQLSPRELVKVISLTSLDFVLGSELEFSSCSIGVRMVFVACRALPVMHASVSGDNNCFCHCPEDEKGYICLQGLSEGKKKDVLLPSGLANGVKVCASLY